MDPEGRGVKRGSIAVAQGPHRRRLAIAALDIRPMRLKRGKEVKNHDGPRRYFHTAS